MSTHFRIIAHNTPEYREMTALRCRVLREPLGLDYSPEQLAAEAGDTLIAAYAENVLIGSLILTPLTEQTAQMRQVAVSPQWQGRGVGISIVAFAESAALERGWRHILLHAREAVVPFYERLGYEAIGEPFIEVGLPHREMRKTLSKKM